MAVIGFQEKSNGRKLPVNQICALGGSSAINLGMLNYLSRSGLDSWQILGKSNWGREELSHYIRKYQNLIPPSDTNREFFTAMEYDENVTGGD